MSTGYTSGKERRHTAEVFRDNWLWLVLLGAVLILAGRPRSWSRRSPRSRPSRILGIVLVVSGLLQIIQSAKMLN